MRCCVQAGKMLRILMPAVVCLPGRITAGTDKFATANYWDAAYQTGQYGESYEWYDLTWTSLRSSLASVLPPSGAASADVLVSGCGNSPISVDMAGDGFARHIVSVDISTVVVDSMRKRHPELTWAVTDIRALAEFENASFDLVFDKGALDAVRGSKDLEQSRSVATAYRRVLRSGGIAAIVTSCEIEECKEIFERHFDEVEARQLPKEGIAQLKAKARAAGYTGPIREYDMLYLARVSGRTRPGAEL